MNKNFQEEIFRELELYFAPLKNASSDIDTLLTFIKTATGWDINALTGGNNSAFLDAVKDIVDELSLLENVYNNPPETFWEFVQSVNSISTLISQGQNIHTSLSGSTVPSNIADLAKDVFNQLTVIYLKGRFPNIYSTLLCFTIIDISDDPFRGNNDTVIKQIDHVNFKIYFNRLSLLLRDPIGFLKSQYMPNGIPDQNTANQVGKKIFTNITYLLGSLNIPYLVGRGQGGQYLTAAEEAKLDGMLTLSKQFYVGQTDNTIEAGASLGLIPSSSTNGSGVFIIPFGTLSVNQNIGNWNVKLNADSNIPGFEINRKGIQVYDSSNKTDIRIELLFEKLADTDDVFLIGSVNGTHLKVGGISIAAFLDVMDEVWSADASVHIKNAAFVLKPGDADNFLKKVLPPDGITTTFELKVGYNSHKGLYFLGGAGLEIEIPIHQKLLGVDFESVVLSVNASPDGNIAVTAGTSFNVAIGPLIASVKRVGLKSNVSFPAGGGNLGPVDMSLGFKHPSGIGISLDSEVITGGGFLSYDENTGTYSGGLELNFSKIALKAIGVLSTRMPDGSNGYSLLIIITAEFTPIQLGLGFTLNGVGGLLGLNRTADTDRLRRGVKDNTLGHILFPKDVVKNANAIISNVTQVFPAKNDRFLIGPMAKIGWGTPTILTIDLGLVVELPNPVTLLILGVVRTALPSDTNRILVIQVNFFGEINFGKKYLKFDASLYDSRILTYGLYGDMALRLYWGEKPNFLLSVGGFHPKFKVPPMDVPQLQRITVSLIDTKNLKVLGQTYFAVTSNSAQFGARVEAMARAWEIKAVGAVWFDVLFQFSPFYFNADMGAMFAIMMGSEKVLSVFINMTLEGPNPWKIQGKASFKITVVRVNVSFDATFGRARTDLPDAINIYPLFQAAILNKDNWIANGPDRNHQLVALRQLPAVSAEVLVDPFGTLQFSQKVVPLGVNLEKYSTSKIKDITRIEIGTIQLGTGTGSIPQGKVEDYFARNEFFYMTDDEKLSRESYEKFVSGATIGNSDEIQSGYHVHREVRFDDIFIDRRVRLRLRDQVSYEQVYKANIADNYITNAPTSKGTKSRVFYNQIVTTEKVKVKEEVFGILDKNTGALDITQPSFKNYTEAKAHYNSLSTTQQADYTIVNRLEL